ncbi:hypothetical protein BR93DRAFT_208319 [Neofusicoccum parvum]|nr:hypothetical protein BR93DRAFT_208319 [Neofusicoccum parvum]
MNHPDVPDLVRAETIIEYAECLQETSTSDEWVGHMEEASKIYGSVGHAYGILSVRAKLLEKRIPKTSTQKAGEELLGIKKSMEEVGYWTGAIDALRAYAQLQMHEFGRLEEETLVEIDSELLRFKDICKNNFDWVSQTNLNFTRWQQSGANVGKGLEVLEKMYADMSDMEAPFLIADTLMKLYEAYTKIGDTASAMACLGRRPEVLPRRMVILLGLDPFYQRLQGGTEVLDHESELSALRGEIEKAEGMIKNTASLQDRGNEVLRLSHISNLYLIHWNLRPIKETRSLIEPCLEAIHSATKHLDKSQASLWTINALQTEARLLFNESHLSAIQEDKLKLMQESLELHEKTFVMFRDVGHKFNMSLAKQSIALCYDSIWQFNGKPSRSDDFEKAASSYEEAKGLLKGTGNFGSEQMITRLLMLLWYRGLQQGVLVKTWFGLSTTSPMQMTLKYVEEAETLATIERCDMAALKPERAVLAKQALRRDDNAQAVYDVAIQVHNHVEDYENTWNWIQRSKARSVSDMLALGVNLPADLVSEIDQHPELREQMDQERSLLESIGEAQSSEKIYLQKQLDALRKKMRAKPILQKVLDLREGQPVSVSGLRDLGKRRAAEGQSRVVFVDWVAINGHIHCLIVSESEVKKVAIGLTVEDATEWKKTYLRQEGRKNHPLEEDEMPESETADNAPPHNPIAALRKLFKYVQEVVQETNDAIIDENSDTSLIERNPIVYTSSMTTLEHCASRQLYRQRTATDIGRSFIAVFEETESGAFGASERATRDQIYSSIRKIATKNPGSSSLFGNEASLSSVSQAFDADFVYFFGHCDFEQENMLHQGLETV